MSKVSYLYLSIALCMLMSMLCLSSCTTTVQVAKPEESYIEKASYDKQLSTINVPLEIPVEEIENLINKHLVGTLYEDKSFSNNGGDNLKCIVKKYAPFKLYAADDRLLISMPLDIAGSYTKLGARVNFKGTLKVTYFTTITLKDDWKVKTETKLYGHEWIHRPEVDLGWVDVPVKWLVDKILDGQEVKINSKIDEAVQNNVDFEELVKPALRVLTRPISISETYDCWLKIEPVEAFITPLKFEDEKLAITIGMQSYTETFIGEPEIKQDSTKVVPLSVADQLPSGFNLDLVTVMPYDKMNVVLYNEFVRSGYEYVDGKYHLTFTEMSMFGQDGKLIIEAGMLGSVKGKIYLIGEPYYDSTDQRIRMKNLDFDFTSKQALLKSADWLAHGALCRIMEKNMYFEIGEELDAAKLEAEEYLDQYEPVTGVTIDGQLDQLETSDVYLIKDAMVVVVNAQGNLNVKVNGVE